MFPHEIATDVGRELLRLRGHNIRLRDTLDSLHNEKDTLLHTIATLREEKDALHGMINALHEQKDALYNEKGLLSLEKDALRTERDMLRSTLEGIYASRSWFLTKPLRAAARLARRIFYPREKENILQCAADDVSNALSASEEAEPVEKKEDLQKQPPMSSLEAPNASEAQYAPDSPQTLETSRHKKSPHGIALDAYCWKVHRTPHSLLTDSTPSVSIWAAKRGNYFFHDIARLLHAGITDAGIAATLNFPDSEEDCLDSINLGIPLRIVVAPHEFFLFVPSATAWPLNGECLWMLNTEQLKLGWFAEGAKHFTKADLILDFDLEAVRQYQEKGFTAAYLPLGFSPSCEALDGSPTIPSCLATEGLPESTRLWIAASNTLHEALSSRPLDCCFFGAATPRRTTFFAQNAPLFAELNAYLRLEDMSHPLVVGETAQLTTAATTAIARRSKIALNLHQADSLYFEWHRIVLLGMLQGACVVSEPCSSSWPLIPNKDYIAAPLNDIPTVLEWILRSPEGMAHAEEIRRHALVTLREHSMSSILTSLIQEYARA